MKFLNLKKKILKNLLQGHGHRWRHKRQQASARRSAPVGGRSSFILTDFVGVEQDSGNAEVGADPADAILQLQNVVDSGLWSEWSEASECSRTCGGGVTTQTRTCLTDQG